LAKALLIYSDPDRQLKQTAMKERGNNSQIFVIQEDQSKLGVAFSHSPHLR